MTTPTDFLEDAFGAINSGVRFARRPDPVPADLRFHWRVAALVLVLHRCRSDTATLQQLHVLTWALRSEETRKTFIRWSTGDKRPDDVIVRYDPALSLSVDLATGFGLVERTDKGHVTLSDTGERLAVAIENESQILIVEKSFLDLLPKRVSQKFVNDLILWK